MDEFKIEMFSLKNVLQNVRDIITAFGLIFKQTRFSSFNYGDAYIRSWISNVICSSSCLALVRHKTIIYHMWKNQIWKYCV